MLSSFTFFPPPLYFPSKTLFYWLEEMISFKYYVHGFYFSICLLLMGSPANLERCLCLFAISFGEIPHGSCLEQFGVWFLICFLVSHVYIEMMSTIFISKSQKLRSCYSLTITMACIKLVLCLFISVCLCSFVHYHDESKVTLSGMRGDIEIYTYISAFLYNGNINHCFGTPLTAHFIWTYPFMLLAVWPYTWNFV